jgi:hypothetical protein
VHSSRSPWLRTTLLVAALSVLSNLSARAQPTRTPLAVTRPLRIEQRLSPSLIVPTSASASKKDRQVLVGAVVGALIGVAATVAAVEYCIANDQPRSEGPPCELGYIYVGVPASAAGALIGALVGWYAPAVQRRPS